MSYLRSGRNHAVINVKYTNGWIARVVFLFTPETVSSALFYRVVYKAQFQLYLIIMIYKTSQGIHAI